MPDHLAPGSRPAAAASTPWAIESCMFTWIFDLRRRRFRRVPSGTALTGPVPSDAWVAYHRIDLHGEAGSFAVTLNPEGTRILRSWLHMEPCRRCGPVPPPAGSTAELTELVERWRAELRAVEHDGRRGTGSRGWATARARRPFSGRAQGPG
ncbi:MAG: hypothetical protein ACRDZ3_22310 [Acidimicrobiia bacterium]